MPPPNKIEQAKVISERGDIPSHESLEEFQVDQMSPGDVIEITTERDSRYNILVEGVVGVVPYVRLLTKTRFDIQRALISPLAVGKSVHFLENKDRNPGRFITSRVAGLKCKCRLVTDRNNGNNKP